MKAALRACLLIGCSVLPAAAQQATIAGIVIDDRTERPIPGVLVYVENQPAFADTDGDGRFSLRVPPGRHSVTASVVGYALLRATVDVRANTPAQVTLRLSEGAGTYTERVTVVGASRGGADDAAGGGALYGRELQNLRGGMLDDPLRAMQMLPSVTATDDFYSEFAVRGSAWRHVGLTVDGIPTRYLMHAVHGVPDGGSIAMLNTEALGAALLLPGSYPQRRGRRLGAEVDLTTRQGNRDGFKARAGMSGTSASFLGEGPLADGRGSWLVSARRSYLDYIIKRIQPDASFAFGFSDVLANIAYDVSSKHSLQLTTIAGRAAFSDEQETGINEEAHATGIVWFSALSWRYTPGPRVALTQRMYSTGLRSSNDNPMGETLDTARFVDAGWRADGTFAAADRWLLEFGGDAQRLGGRHALSRFGGAPLRPVLHDAYNDHAGAYSAYADVRATVTPRFIVSPGVRVDSWRLTNTATASPWLTAEYRVGDRTRVRGGTGVYRQFADFEQVFGFNGGGRLLSPERAVHADVGVERSFSDTTRLSVTGYIRDEHDVMATPGIEPRRTATGTLVAGRPNAPWSNVLDGRARGAEVVVRRDSPSGLSGWAGYGYGRLRYTLTPTGEAFWAEADQRHTLSVYGNYRLSSRTSLSLKYRHGSNYPIVGYIGDLANAAGAPARDGFGGRIYTLVEERNTLRLPAYSRLDVRGDRAFNWGRRRLVLFVEVTNVLNHENRRSTPYGIDRLGRVFNATETLMPIIPSAGFSVEF